MPDFGQGAFGRPQGPGDGAESLDAIARSDQLLDALAGQYRARPSDAGEAEMLALLEGWRDGVRRPPSNGLITEREAAEAIHRGLVQQQPAHLGARRHLAAVGSMAAAVLCIGGFGAVVAGSAPGDPLYGMRTALFGEPQSVRDDRVSLAAQTEMAEVQRLIEQGDWDQAQQKLETITTAVADVEDTSRQQVLQDQWNQLNVKVESRDPAATVPPTVPPGPETLPPSLTVPGSETSPSETSGETSPSESTPPATSTETTPSSGVGSTEPSATTSPSSAVPPTTTQPSTTPSTTAPSTTTPSTSAPTSTTPSTTTTAPTTTTTTTTPPPAVAEEEAQQAPEVSATTSAPVRAAPSSAVTTTVVQVPTETVPSGQQSPEVAEAPEQSVVTPTTTTVVPPVFQLPAIPGFN